MPTSPQPNTPPGSIASVGGQVVIFNGHKWIPLIPTYGDTNMDKFRVTYQAHHVNTKRLLDVFIADVNAVVSEFVYHRTSLSTTYDYSQLVDYITMVLDQMQDLQLITTYDVIGDHRNNDPMDVKQGKIHIQVKYVQFNCLNTTRVDLNITKV